MEINIQPDWAEKGSEKNTTTIKPCSHHFLGMWIAANTRLGAFLRFNLNLMMIYEVGTSHCIFTDGKKNARTQANSFWCRWDTKWHLQGSTSSLSDFKIQIPSSAWYSLKTRDAMAIQKEGGRRKKDTFLNAYNIIKEENNRIRKEVGQALLEGQPHMNTVWNDSDRILPRNGLGHGNIQSRWPRKATIHRAEVRPTSPNLKCLLVSSVKDSWPQRNSYLQ